MTDKVSALYGWRNVEPYVEPRDICGTIPAYTAGCRCDDCREASRAARAKYRTKNTDAPTVARDRRGEWRRHDDHVIPDYDPAVWTDRALCRGLETAMFFPEKGGNNWTPYVRARDLCGRCPVADDCLLYALRNREHHGLWGGIPERQRRPLERMTEEEALDAAREIRAAWAPRRRH